MLSPRRPHGTGVKLVLIPGWNEAADDLRLLVDGRRGKPGFAQAGFDCVFFSDGEGGLRRRIDQFAAFLTTQRSRGERVAVFGYSAGGLVARGFLRAYPDRAGELAAIFQVGAPNAGLVTDDVGHTLRLLRFSGDVIDDLDIESDFIKWLNNTPGHWEKDEDGRKHWRLDRRPWIAPSGASILNLVGRPPRYAGDSDGVVLVESATLGGILAHESIDAPTANHLNLCGLTNVFMVLFRRWIGNDLVWPTAVERATKFFAGA
jgi:pimeloyl-ACP methyl ester carboxylesterase